MKLFIVAAVLLAFSCMASANKINLTEVSSADQVKDFVNMHQGAFLTHIVEENKDVRKIYLEALDLYHEFLGNKSLSAKFIFLDAPNPKVARQFELFYSPSLKFIPATGESKEFDFFNDKGFDAKRIFRFVRRQAFPEHAEPEDEEASRAPDPIAASESTIVEDEPAGSASETTVAADGSTVYTTTAMSPGDDETPKEGWIEPKYDSEHAEAPAKTEDKKAHDEL